MLDFFLILLALLALSLLLTALAFIAITRWIAKGEPDVNGDPERDSGADEPWPVKCHRCHATIRPGRGQASEWIICDACERFRQAAKCGPLSSPTIPKNQSCGLPPGSQAAGIVTARVRGSGAETFPQPSQQT